MWGVAAWEGAFSVPGLLVLHSSLCSGTSESKRSSWEELTATRTSFTWKYESFGCLRLSFALLLLRQMILNTWIHILHVINLFTVSVIVEKIKRKAIINCKHIFVLHRLN